jgi:flavin reductase (DIM6/NTAB) family NADH-FMN oxidoreductase RutF
MRKISFIDAIEHTSPQPVALICVPAPSGETNLAPVAWWTYLEHEPQLMGFSMAKESYTCELLTVGGVNSVVLCLPGGEIADEVLKCGVVSGRNVNKAKEYNIELTGDSAKFPVHSKLAYICTVEQRVIVGDCVFFVLNVNEVFINEKIRHIYTWGRDEKLKPIG